MVAREGNVLKVPGTSGTPEVKGDEILGSYARFTQKGLTLKANSGVLEAGTLLKASTTAKKYDGVADATGISGTVGILRKGVDTTGQDRLANYVRSGIVKAGKLKYASGAAVASADYAAVATALGGTYDAIHGYIIL
jgi:hypothetical protein